MMVTTSAVGRSNRALYHDDRRRKDALFPGLF